MARAGSSRYLSWVSGLEPAGATASTGNRPSLTPIRYCSVTPETNSGMDELAKPERHHRPVGHGVAATGREHAGHDADRDGQEQAERDQLGRAAERRPQQVADRPVELEGVAEVERDRALEQPSVLDREGVVRPESLVERSTVSWGANGPAICRPTSPGSTLTIKNTIVTNRNSVMIDRAIRRST